MNTRNNLSKWDKWKCLEDRKDVYHSLVITSGLFCDKIGNAFSMPFGLQFAIVSTKGIACRTTETDGTLIDTSVHCTVITFDTVTMMVITVSIIIANATTWVYKPTYVEAIIVIVIVVNVIWARWTTLVAQCFSEVQSIQLIDRVLTLRALRALFANTSQRSGTLALIIIVLIRVWHWQK